MGLNSRVINIENIKNRGYIFLHALAFVLGFSLIFVIGWGGATTILGQFFITYKDWIARIGGVVLIVFGLATMDIIHISWFSMDTRHQFKGKTGTFWGSIAMGVFFAAGWSPCIGATLGAILTLGFSSDTAGQAMRLSLGYSLGLGSPIFNFSSCCEPGSSARSKIRQAFTNLSDYFWAFDHRDWNFDDHFPNDRNSTLGTSKWFLYGLSIRFWSTEHDNCNNCRNVIVFISLRIPSSSCIFGLFKWSRYCYFSGINICL